MTMTSLCTGLTLLLLWSSAAMALAADAPAVHMSEPRGFGHFVGDLIQRTAEIDVAEDETFVAASLPQPGQLAYWLELRDVATAERSHSGTRRLSLILTYQLFYVTIDPRKVKIPPVNIELKRPSGTRLATIPALTFLISPLREIYPEKSGETTETFLKDDARAERLKTAPTRTAALSSALTAALALLLLAYHRAWWPFHMRPNRPFTEAERTVADHRQTYATALIALHRAFDRSQGERILAADLDAFFSRRPEQTPLRETAHRFFAASQTLFFSGDPIAAEASLPRSALERFAGELAANERAQR